MQKERNITVLNSRHIYASSSKVPSLTLEGLWLQELGFKPGDCAHIECSEGKLTITRRDRADKPMSQQAADCVGQYMGLSKKERRMVMEEIRRSN